MDHRTHQHVLGQFRRLLVRHENLLPYLQGLLLSRLPLDHTAKMFMKHTLLYFKPMLYLLKACVLGFRINEEYQKELYYHHRAKENEWVGA